MITRRQFILTKFRKISTILLATALTGALLISPGSIAASIFINPGLGGSWYQPTHDLQGVILEFVPTTNQMSVYWFTYAEDGSQLWLAGQGPVIDDRAELEFIATEGGGLARALPASVQAWGTGSIQFDSCNEARMEYASNDGLQVGSIDLVRLMPDFRCQAVIAQGPSQYVLAASGSALSLNGLWSFSRCVPIGDSEGTSFEIIEFVDKQLSLTLDRHQTANCSDPPFRVNIPLQMEITGIGTATLADETVTVTRVILTELNSGEVLKQVFYVDDSKVPTRLHHGVFADDGGPQDAEGYPVLLHEAFLER